MQLRKKRFLFWTTILIALFFFIFMALLPLVWEEGGDVPAPSPTISGSS